MLVLCCGLSAETLDPRFHSFDEIKSFLDSLDQLEEYEDLFRVDTLGYSGHEALPILAVKISDNVQEKEDEPRVLFLGQCHAEEILGVEAVLDLVLTVLDPRPSMATHAQILRQEMETWIIPTYNPEGLTVVHSGLDLSFRKNKHDFSADGPSPNGIFDYDASIGNDIDGVDLNRNYDFNWIFGDTFLENDPSDYGAHYDYYRGPEPFSEPETEAIRDLALEQDFLLSIAWHSSRSGRYSEKVISSWNWADGKNTPDNDAQKAIGDELADRIQKENSEEFYQSVQSVSRRGNAHDWFYSATGCFQYLVECGTANLQPDSALIENTMQRLVPGMLYLMDRIIGYQEDAAQITGIVTDEFGNPLEDAEIIINELNGGVLQPRLTDEFGRYRRIVTEGTYQVMARKYGYEPITNYITANNSGITTLDFSIQPAQNVTLTLNVDVPTLFSTTSFQAVAAGQFGTDTFSVSTGANELSLQPGFWNIQILGDTLFPWIREMNLEQNTGYFMIASAPNVQYSNAFSDSTFWTMTGGEWSVENDTLKSQSEFTYANGSTEDTVEVRSRMIKVSGMKQVAVEFTHRYELEWDVDSIIISIVNSQDSILAEYAASGHYWEAFRTDRIAARDTSGFDSVQVKISFHRDNSMQYRGWEIASLTIMGAEESYLSVTTDASAIRSGLSVSNPYPNPSTGIISINLSDAQGPVSISIYNLLGQEVHSGIIPFSPNPKTIWAFNMKDRLGAGMSSGVYFLRFKSPQKTIIRKCVYLRP